MIMPMMFVDELGFTTLGMAAGMGGILLHHDLFERFLGDCGGENGLDEGYPLVRLHRDGAFQPGVLLPAQHFGHNFAMALVPAIARGIFVAAFVPMAAVFSALEPEP